VLKWSYVYGFYLKDEKEQNLFQFMQENLEKNCDYLHELIEKPLDPFLNEDVTDKKPFYEYKSELVNYYQVTRNVRVCRVIMVFSSMRICSMDSKKD